jgi:hypothetical protein
MDSSFFWGDTMYKKNRKKMLISLTIINVHLRRRRQA